MTLITVLGKGTINTHICRSISVTSSLDKIMKILTCMSHQKKLKDSKIITEKSMTMEIKHFAK